MTGALKFVSAGAGSGKTYRLTRILYEKLRDAQATPAGVIATTFTRKAAAELRERVRSALLEEGEFALANAMGQARIGTVNSVCGALLERFAFEAGLSPEQRVLEDAQAGKLVNEAIDDVSDSAAIQAIVELARRLGIAEWQRELRALIDLARANDIAPARLTGLAARNADDLLAHFPAPSAQGPDAVLVRAIEAALPRLEESSMTTKTVEYVALAREAAQAVRAGRSTWEQWVKLAKAEPEARLKEIAQPVAEAAGRYVAHARLRDDIASYLQAVFGLAARALDAYARRKRELGVVDFVDQEHLFLGLLDRPEVVAALSEELELLLVDEFQDTSPIQLALFMRLARIARETVWVGDVKQAIYGFRGSDTELMKAVLAALPRLGGSKELLKQSRRSRPHLVHLVNAAFAGGFAPALSSEEVELDPVREEKLPEAAFATWVLNGTNIDQRAAALAAGIRALIGSGYRIVDPVSGEARAAHYGDVAVLSSTNAGVKALATALRAASLPWATEQPGLLATPEAVLALACLRRLHDPRDTVASAEIVSLADCEEPESWLADRLRYLDAGGDGARWRETGEGAHALLARIAGLRVQAQLLSPCAAMELVITQCDLSARILRWRRSELVGRVRLANLQALVALVRTYEDACLSRREPATLSGLLLWLGEQAAAGLDMLAQPPVDAVKVMTQHASKGLEWPIVIVLDLEKDVRDRLWSAGARSESSLDVAAPLKDRWIRYWPWPFGAQRKVEIAERIARSGEGVRMRAEAIDEAKRLLYVTMTRARDFLIVALPAKTKEVVLFTELGAPWLAGDEGMKSLRLAHGHVLPYRWQAIDPPELAAPSPEQEGTLRWFEPALSRTGRLPAVVLASAASTRVCTVIETQDIGARVKLGSAIDMTALGTAVHACVAAALSATGAKFDLAAAARIVRGFGVDAALDCAALVRQIDALERWVEARWPNCRRYPEMPIEAVLPEGQVVHGRIDLLLDTRHGWVLIDHKSNPAPRQKWEQVAAEHAEQLSIYAGALERVTGRAVREIWIVLPIAAGAIRIQNA